MKSLTFLFTFIFSFSFMLSAQEVSFDEKVVYWPQNYVADGTGEPILKALNLRIDTSLIIDTVSINYSLKIYDPKTNKPLPNSNKIEFLPSEFTIDKNSGNTLIIVSRISQDAVLLQRDSLFICKLYRNDVEVDQMMIVLKKYKEPEGLMVSGIQFKKKKFYFPQNYEAKGEGEAIFKFFYLKVDSPHTEAVTYSLKLYDPDTKEPLSKSKKIDFNPSEFTIDKNSKNKFEIVASINPDTILLQRDSIFICKLYRNDVVMDQMIIVLKKYEEPHGFDANVPVRVGIGANFDFFDDTRVGLFGDFQVTYPELYITHKLKKNGTIKKKIFGIVAGFSEFKTHQDNVYFRDHYRYPVFASPNTVVISEFSDVTQRTEVTNWTFYINFLFGKPFETNINGRAIYIYKGVIAEGVYRTFKHEYDYSPISIDTLPSAYDPNDDFIHREDFIHRKTYEGYLGHSWILLTQGKVHGSIMPTIGIAIIEKDDLHTLSGYQFREQNPIESKCINWLKKEYSTGFYLYYNLRFNFIEPKLGLTLGGEIRHTMGYMKPFWEVHLAKSFNLTKLLDYQ